VAGGPVTDTVPDRLRRLCWGALGRTASWIPAEKWERPANHFVVRIWRLLGAQTCSDRKRIRRKYRGLQRLMRRLRAGCASTRTRAVTLFCSVC